MDGGTVTALVLSGVSSATAGWSLLYGRRQARAAAHANSLTERAQREQSEPYVIADIRPRSEGSELLWLVIENTGPTLARDVKVAVTPPLRSSLGSKREDALQRVISRVIPSMPPRCKLGYTMDVGHGLFGDPLLPRVYTFTVNVTGPYGPMDPLTYVVDLSALGDTSLQRDTVTWATKDIAKHLKEGLKAQVQQAKAVTRLAEYVGKEIEVRHNPNPPQNT